MARRVLTFDDDVDMQLALAEALDVCGWETYVASSADEARYALDAWRPALLLLDLHCHDTHRLARTARSLAIPIVLVSGSGDDYLAAARRTLGATAALGKPFALNELREVLAALPPPEFGAA
jgi:DNA-binding response OmpR family regulator